MGRATSLKELINSKQCNSVFNLKLNNSVQCNNNVGMWKTQRANRISSNEAEAKAEFLVQRLDAPQSRKFFLKCIYYLSEADIQEALDCATKPYVRCKAKYFNRICKTKLDRRGV